MSSPAETTKAARTALDDIFDVTSRSGDVVDEIVEKSTGKPLMLDNITEAAPVTFTIVENGTQRSKLKLVRSDGYEYTK